MTKRIYKYFTCANSSIGFVSFFEQNLEGLENVYILKGGPGTGKSTLMKKIGEYFLSQGENIDHIYCSSDANSLDGIIINNRKTAVVDGTSPHVIEPKAPGAVEEYINLGKAWDRSKLKQHKSEILDIKQQISKLYNGIYSNLSKAKTVHDDWEKIYLDNIDYSSLDSAAVELCDKIVGSEIINGNGKIIDRFFGALTPNGSVNYIENLTSDLSKRYFIKGRPGTGKSTLMKKIANLAKDNGHKTEVYHCSFDPDSLDMVIIRDLNVCIFDSTSPHELFPSRTSDEIVDLYQAAVKPETDEENSARLAAIQNRYDKLNSQARCFLSNIHTLHDELESIYINAMDFDIINSITSELINNIEDCPIVC